MYIESNGELGFPHHRMGPGGEGGWRHHMQSGGPGAEMQVQPGYAAPTAPPSGWPAGAHHHHRRHHMMRGADGVEIMGPPAAPSAGAPVVVPPVVMQPVSSHGDTAMYVAGGVMVLGLAYVLYKVVKS